MEWNGMWNEKKMMEWNGNGMKINKILWNGMEVESRKISGNSTGNLFDEYSTKFLYFLKNTKKYLLTNSQ